MDREDINLFVDKKNNVVVIPLCPKEENQGVLVTTPEKGDDALKAALMIQKLLQRFPETRKKEKNQSIEDCIRSFKNFDFKTCIQIAEKGLKD